MAQAKSKRRSRKRRKPGQTHRPAQAAPTRSTVRQEARAERQVLAERDERRAQSSLGTYGERPPSPFGGLPVSEVAIFVGAVGTAVGFASAARAPLIVGIVVCTLGVLEFTLREHLSGYRSHATLLAGIPAVALLAIGIAVFGAPRQRSTRELLLLAAVPVFAILFWALRKRFRTARQARIIRPPAP